MVVSALALLTLAIAPVGQAQTVDPNLYGTNGAVSAQMVIGNTLYIGGSFGGVGKPTGGFATVDDVTGAPTGAFPEVAGTVNAIASDGVGGWFIGGAFNTVGGLPRANLAHVLSDNSVGPWNPGANSTVMSLALDGTTLYVGGLFTDVGGSPRAGLAAVDAGSGAVGAWNPGAGGQFSAIAVVGTTVYVSGFFTSIGGQPRSCIAALDAATGLATPWNPGANSNVFALVPAGGIIYIGGAFTAAGGQTRSKIAAIDAVTGLATAWNPNAIGPATGVRVLAVDGNTVFAGGAFTTIGGQPRNRIAAIDATTGLATAWNPDANSEVRAIRVEGSTIRVAGLFTFAGGQQRNRAAELDAVTGLATGWNPDCSSTAFAVAKSGSTVALGGSFTGLAFVPRSSLAAIDLNTGQVTGWNPGGINGTVQSMASDGTSLYIGGLFTVVGPLTRNRIAEVDLITGMPTAWDPNVTGTSVAALALDGSKLYAGGNFTAIGGQPRTRIAEIDRGTGAPTAWDPIANNNVNGLAVDGGVVYATGFFTSVGGQTRAGVAAVDRATGMATAWNPNPAGGTCAAVTVANGKVYVGGAFSSIGGQPFPSLAAIDPTTGLAASWNPGLLGGNITTIRVSSSAVYIGGIITQVGGQSRRGIAALDPATGAVLNWCPTGTAGTGNVNSLVLSGSSVFAGGSFLSMEGVSSGFVAKIDAVPAVTYALTTTADPAHGGAVTRSPDQATYDPGAVVELTAVPTLGNRFVGWSGDLAGTTNPQIVTMSGARFVTAHFEAIPLHELVVLLDPNPEEMEVPPGYVEGQPGAPLYEGEVVTLTAFPDDAYVFAGWSGDVTSAENPVTFTMDGPMTVTAHFEPAIVRISATRTPIEGGTIVPGGAVSVPHGGDQTFVFTPAEHFRIQRVRVDGVDLGPLTSYTFTNVRNHHSLNVAFATDTFTIAATASPGGSLTPSGNVRAVRFTSPTFTTHSFGLSVLADLVVDGQSVLPLPRPHEGYGSFAYTFPEIHANHTIHATFVPGHIVRLYKSQGGTTNPDAPYLQVPQGESRTISFTPEPGYALVEVEVDGVPRGPVSSYTFDNITAPHTLVAHFAPECMTFRDDFESTLAPGWEIHQNWSHLWGLDDGNLRIHMARGDLWEDTDDVVNMFLRSAPAGDFVVETSLNATLLYDIHQAHLILYLNHDYYLRFGLVRLGGLVVDHVHEVGGHIAQAGNHGYSSGTVHLRITVTGTSARAEYSADRIAWTTLATVPDLGFRPVKAGLVAFQGISGFYGSSTANYDYFSLNSAGDGPGGAEISGTVTAACGGPAGPLHGVTLDLYSTGEDDTDVLVASTPTDETGSYSFAGVPPGEYTVGIVTPLGYQTAATTREREMGPCGAVPGDSDFALTCIPITAQPRGMGYWKHQVNVHLTGRGQAQESLDAMIGYIEAMVTHFNENLVNPVIVFVPGAATSQDELLQLQQLLTVNRGGTELDRAKQHLLSMLLNVVSLKLAQTHVISADGATVSQAITYCHDLILDGDPANDATAKQIAEMVNSGVQVPAGMVPTSTRVITYDHEPVEESSLAFGLYGMANPVRGAFLARVGVGSDAPARLELIDIAGRRVWRHEITGTGRQSVRVGDGVSLASGVYRLRLVQGAQVATRTVVVTR